MKRTTRTVGQMGFGMNAIQEEVNKEYDENDGASALGTRNSNEQYVKQQLPYGRHTAADECDTNDVPAIVEHAANKPPPPTY